MSKNGKFAGKGGANQPGSKLVLILSCIAGALLVLLIVMILLIPDAPVVPDPTTEPTETTEATTEATEETTESTEETSEPEETEPVMLAHMAELYAKNPDVVGWIKIDGTKLDDPIVYTPEDENKYLRMSLDGWYSAGGLPILDKDCAVDPETQVLIIHGHNMLDGSKFNTIMKYSEKKYWEEHPVIQLTTLYEEREYEVIAAFYDRVYKKSDEVFKFYNFIDPQTEEEFNEGINYFKTKSVYDTGVTAEYGDRLITLVTCSYHEAKGRFVVVAREIVDEPENPAE